MHTLSESNDCALELEEQEEIVEDEPEDELKCNKSEMFPSLVDVHIIDAGADAWSSSVRLGSSTEWESIVLSLVGDRWAVYGRGGRGGGVLPGFNEP